MWICKCFFDISKEEKWLEEMARQGYRLRKGGNGSYHFNYVKIPGEYNIKIDYRNFHKEKDFMNYCSLFEDSGWHHISGSRWSGAQYFVRARAEAGDDIFSDNLSRAGRYKRISHMWLSLTIAYIFLLLSYIATGIIDLHKILDLKSLYLTPGIWDMKGFDFMRAFLIETPFALMRGFSWSIFVLIIGFYVFYSFKSYSMYQKEMKKNI